MSASILPDAPQYTQDPFGGNSANWTPSADRATEHLTRLAFERHLFAMCDVEEFFGPEPVESPSELPGSTRMCAWCHGMSGDTYCPADGHEVGVARMDCRCPDCAAGEEPREPLMTQHTAETQRIDVRAATEIAKQARTLATAEWNALPPDRQAERGSLDKLIEKHFRRLERDAA